MTIEELRVKITAKIDELQEGIKKATSKLDSFRKTSEDVNNQFGNNINKMRQKAESLKKSLEQTQMKIQKIEEQLSELYAKQSSIVEEYRSRPALKGLNEEDFHLLVSEMDAEYKKVSNTIKKLEKELEPLRAKSNATKEELNKLSHAMQNISSTTQKASRKINEATKKTSTLNRRIKEVTRSTKKSTGTIAGFWNMIDRSLRRVLRRLFVYNVFYKMIRSFITYMGSALKTNDEFSRSLNVIKTNLRVAFQPIYDFILPAINALMKAIATITTYIASAISSLFGKTYQQSFNAAKNLNEAISNTGESAKKAGKDVKGALAPFDELNQLMLNKNGETGADSDEFKMEMPDLAKVDMTGIEKIKERLSNIFEPIKLAWENQGKATIDAIKNSFNSVLELIHAIGRSWEEVWTNSTGQKSVENILLIIQNIFSFVGNLADAFRNAWEQNNIGISIVQNIADIFNIILETIRNITGATAEWVKGLDFTPLLESVNKLLEALKPITENIGQGLAWLWENVLLPLASWTIEDVLPRFLETLANVINILNPVLEALQPLATWLWEEFLKPLAQWTGEAILQALDWLNDKLTALSTWIQENQSTIQNLAIIVGSFAAAWGLVNAAITIWNGIATIATGVTSAFGTAIGFLTSPIGIVTAAIGGLIAIGVLLYKNWDEIGPFLKKTWESIENKAKEIWNGIKEFFSNTWDNIKTKTSETWNNIKSFLIDKIWNPIKDSSKNIWEGIKQHIIEPIQNAWSNLKQTWDNIKTYILNKWNEIKTGISNTKNNLVNAIKEPFNIAKEWISGIIGDAFNWGKNLIGNIVDGIESMIRKVKDAVGRVAETIKDFLGFSSPTKKGPGSMADKWMPNLMDMLAQGIKDNTFKIEGAVNMTANSLSNIQRPDNTSAIVNAITGALSVRDRDLHLIIKLGEDTITEKVISNINRKNRIAGATVIRV